MGKSSRAKSKKPVIQTKEKNWFPLIVTGAAVLAVVVIIAVVAFLNNRATEPVALPESAQSTIIAADGGIQLSEGPTEVDVYLDTMCPFCGQFERGYTSLILADSDLGLTVRPISILDNFSQGTQYSTRAASSIYAVAHASDDAAVTAAYIGRLFDPQPEEGTEGLTNEELFQIADELGVTITEADLEPYETFVQKVMKDVPIGPDNTTVVTPTILVDGKFTSITMNAEQDIASWK